MGAGGSAGDDGAILSQYRIGLELHPGVAVLQPVDQPPTDGGLAAIEHTTVGQPTDTGAVGTQQGATSLSGVDQCLHLGFGGKPSLQVRQLDVADRWQTDGVGVPQAGEISVGGDWDAT